MKLARRIRRAAAAIAIACSPAVSLQTEPELAKAQRAQQAMEAGRYAQAEALYRELVNALPTNAGLRMNLGLSQFQAGQYREAAANLQLALKQDEKLKPAWLMLGMARLKMGEAARAVGPLERFLRFEPDNREVMLELASACLQSGRPQDALVHFRRLTDLMPGEPKPWQGVALSYAALSQDAFHRLEAAAPQSGYRMMLLARSAFARGQNLSAMRLYRDAIAKTPGLRGAHAGVAETYRKTGHPDWAVQEDASEAGLPALDCAAHPMECHFAAGEYARVFEISQAATTVEALYWRSRACSSLADEALRRLAGMPPSSAIHELLAEAARLRGDLDGAIREWDQALAMTPGDRRIEKGLARVLWLKRDPRALPALTRLARLEPESAEINYQLGDLLVDEDAARGVEVLQTALKLQPDHTGAHAALGRAYVRLEKPALAIPQLRAALAMDTDGKLYYQLARAYQMAGQEALARQTMQKYRELSAAARARRPAMDEAVKGRE